MEQQRKIRSETSIRNTSIQKNNRDTTEMVRACKEMGQIEHREKSTNDRHSKKKRKRSTKAQVEICV